MSGDPNVKYQQKKTNQPTNVNTRMERVNFYSRFSGVITDGSENIRRTANQIIVARSWGWGWGNKCPFISYVSMEAFTYGRNMQSVKACGAQGTDQNT